MNNFQGYLIFSLIHILVDDCPDDAQRVLHYFEKWLTLFFDLELILLRQTEKRSKTCKYALVVSWVESICDIVRKESLPFFGVIKSAHRDYTSGELLTDPFDLTLKQRIDNVISHCLLISFADDDPLESLNRNPLGLFGVLVLPVVLDQATKLHCCRVAHLLILGILTFIWAYLEQRCTISLHLLCFLDEGLCLLADCLIWVDWSGQALLELTDESGIVYHVVVNLRKCG